MALVAPLHAAETASPTSTGNASIALPIFGVAALIIVVLLVRAVMRPKQSAALARMRAAKPAAAPRTAGGDTALPSASPASVLTRHDVHAAQSERLRAATPAQVLDEPQHEEFGADFYDEVARLLRSELDKHPARRDLRFKLLEVYASAHQREHFIEQTQRYIEVLNGQLDSYWPRIVEMGLELAPETGLYTAMPPLATPDLQVIGVAKIGHNEGRRFYDGVNPMTLGMAQAEIQDAYKQRREDPAFWQRVQELSEPQLAIMPPIIALDALSHYLGGAQIYVEDGRDRSPSEAAVLGAVGQIVLAQTMGKQRIVCGGLEDAHALTAARTARALGLACTVYVDQRRNRHATLVTQLQELGAELMPVREAALGDVAQTQLQTLSDALEDTRRSFYVCPLAAGPAPYPMIVRDMQGVAGRMLRTRIHGLLGRLPDALLVSSADGMHAVGLLHPFLTSTMALHCVDAFEDHARSSRERFAREHSWLRATERVRYAAVAWDVAAFFARHARPVELQGLHLAGGEVLAEAFRLARELSHEQTLLVVIPADQRNDTAG